MKYITAVFFLFIVAVIIMANTRTFPPPLKAIYDFPNGDKAGLFILYGILNFLTTTTFLRSLPSRDRNLLALSVGLILALGIAAEEYSQKFIPSRTFSYIDLTFSYMGVILGGWIALKLNNKSR